MSILIFIGMIVILVVAHEYGHFVAAKLAKMRVFEFGIGFPPKLFGRMIGETEYTVNALPFGGFVRIFGEDDETSSEDPRAFANRPRLSQALVIFSGPFANIILAYVCIVSSLIIGVPTVIDGSVEQADIRNAHTVVTNVIDESPAAHAGILQGDTIVRVDDQIITSPQDLSDLIHASTGSVSVSIKRNGEEIIFSVLPKIGIVEDEPTRQAIGIGTVHVGVASFSVSDAFARGLSETVEASQAVALGLISLIGGAFTLSADISEVAGPVGIASLVGDASSYGIGSLLSLAAIISINLGIINLIPFPALDGGRLAMLAVEASTRKRIPHRISNAINYVGFAILIVLMVAVTVQDISRLVS